MVSNAKGLVAGSQAALGSVSRVGGRTPVCTASTALISPARPAAHLAWPMRDFTEPSEQAPGRAPAVREHLGERLQFGAVAEHGPGAVRLDQAHLAG